MSGEPVLRHRRSVMAAIRDACRGLATLWMTQRNVRIHVLFMCCVGSAAVALGVNGLHWCLLSLSVGLVLVAEALNTAIEFLADAVHPEPHPLIGQAKDVAAAGVLLTAIAAIVVGVTVFGPLVVMRFWSN